MHIVESADGEGRTLWEILTGKNKKDIRSQELIFFNPLDASIGQHFQVDANHLSDINFRIERITVYETVIGKESYYHTDYHLRGLSVSEEKPVRFRLRLIPDADETNDIGCRIQILHLYHEMPWDQEFEEGVLRSETNQIQINHDDEGNELSDECVRNYWRVDLPEECEYPLDPYSAKVSILEDLNQDGHVSEEEVTKQNVTYWEYARITTDHANQEFTESLTVEKDADTGYFTFLRGSEIPAFQITLI